MSRTLQDQFIDDDEEETCPLCVEEFDLSDKGFRPCPCGYQICQFCYHNVRTNMNGLCPACRRPYEESSIEFRKPSAEEEAAWKAKQANKQKKTAVAQQKEVLKREADTANRKHLAGLRVVQKNLVYVTGLSPSVQEDRLLETLRGPQYFGQYGKIVKIVVSKAKDNQSSVGVYVTYARKEDAASCINAVDGSQNGERTLRAQFGTTKYCSAYLRNEQCQNRNCMFLHEPGEDKDSFTRQDLSSMNVASTQQQPSSYPPNQPPPQSQQPVAAARPESTAPSNISGESGPALPSTASWASKPYPPSRSVSRAATATSASPALTNVQPAQPVPEEPAPSSLSTTQPEEPLPTIVAKDPQIEELQPIREANPFVDFIHSIMTQDPLDVAFDTSTFTEEHRKVADHMPCMIDPSGGRKRRLARTRIEEEQQRRLEERVAQEENEEQLQRSGSLQLGGEPDDPAHGQQHAIQPPQSGAGQDLDNELSQLNLNARGMTPAQQQLLLQRFQSSPSQQSVGSQQAGFQGQFGQANPPGHARNVSRFSFANDSSAATSVKPVANSKLMQQQSAMMPLQTGNAFGQQPFYTSTVSGPPPGLKTTGTPPVSGGGMFGQGHGFATSGLGYGSNMPSRNSNDEMMRELFRRRDLGGQDAGKQTINQADVNDPFGTPSATPSQQQGEFPFRGRSTPTIPPGLEGLGQVPPGQSAAQTSQTYGVVRPAIPAVLQARSAAGSRKPSIASLSSRPGTPSIKSAAEEKKVVSAEQKEPAQAPLEKIAIPDALKPMVPNTVPAIATPKKTLPPTKTAETKATQKSEATLKPSKTTVKDQATKGHDVTAVATPTKPALPETPVSKGKHDPKQSTPSASLDSAKRKLPGKIDIPVAITQPEEALKPSTAPSTAKATVPGTPSVSSRPASPGFAEVAGKKKVNTIRIVNTSQPAPIINTPFAAAVAKLPSRNPSIASANPPGTPSSEHISDTVSLTSASISRPHSPTGSVPGGIVGSAPVSRSAAAKKRERQRRQQEQEQKVAEADTVADEPIQEAITSHKRSTKSKAAASKPKPKPKAEAAVPSATTDAPSQQVDAPAADASQATRGIKQSTKPKQVETSAPPVDDNSPASLIREAQKVLPPFIAKALDGFFCTVAQNNAVYKPTQPITAADIDTERTFLRHPPAPFEHKTLNRLLKDGTPFRYGGGDDRIWSQGCVTPDGAHLRYLESELEERYWQLEQDFAHIPQSWRYKPDRTRKWNGVNIYDELPYVDLETLRAELENGGGRRREANAMEKAVEEGSKKGSFLVGNAEAYINEFVMPVVRDRMSRPGQEGKAEGEEKRSLEEIEKALVLARKVAEQKEAELRKVIKKNRKVVGLV
ncbi:hypothetical protein KVT40_003322 [Elsinoe batatas]|uniref:General negative regulator of transcription subunit 4 n=1 Tax=Elsinoe batatas TaxID=2601811 RepID=A0A8K0L5P9_9PEZI|nr:hypothetical protein KVT40_003322 [Elsinoe batatas]